MVRVRLKLLIPILYIQLFFLVTSKGEWVQIEPEWDGNSLLQFNAFNRTFRVILEKTKHLLSDEFKTHHQHPDTNEIVENVIGKKESEKCHWQGHLEGAPGSRVAISRCPHLSGVIWNDDDTVIYLHHNGSHSLASNDLNLPQFKCGYNHSTDAVLSRSRRGIAKLVDVENPPSATDSHSRFVEIVFVHDNKQYKKFGQNETALFQRSMQIANIVNALYAPLNIFVILVGVRVWSGKDEIEVDKNAEKTLDNFLQYRMDVLAKTMPNDNAQLITDILFENDVVGKALKGPICTYQYSGGVNKDHHDSVAVVAATIAHELGHNFGLEHDDVGQCTCPQSRCIMFPASNIAVPPKAWSSCSLEAVKDAFSQHMDHCLMNIPKKIVGSSCGNGIVEQGEECDCGPLDFCATRCCNPKTCKLAEGAQCGHGECCDLQTCQPKNAGTMCRDATSECDLPEHCDGGKFICPPNVFKANGDKCGDGDAYCYKGSCASHTMQCKSLWGPTGAVGHRACFTGNINGTQLGNCGYDKNRKTFTKCKQKDIMCGTLHCTHLNERLEYGMLSAAKLSRFYLKTERDVHVCRSAVVDLGATDPDPGQVPDGAACGNNQACLNSRCVVLAQLTSQPCEYNCFGHGICNNLGHCHCDPGYAPPYCNFPGNGGSVDSGPTNNLDGESYTKTIILCVIFLGILPLVLFFLAWSYSAKLDLMAKWRLRRRKMAVKSAARQGPLMNLCDKTQISKPVIDSMADVDGIYQNCPLRINKALESNVDSQFKPARPAPPPPLNAAKNTEKNNSTKQTNSDQFKRSKTSTSSIRRPNGPPPPKPSPLYENLDVLRAQINDEKNKKNLSTRGKGTEDHPLV